jgi:hypothetical protein
LRTCDGRVGAPIGHIHTRRTRAHTRRPLLPPLAACPAACARTRAAPQPSARRADAHAHSPHARPPPPPPPRLKQLSSPPPTQLARARAHTLRQHTAHKRSRSPFCFPLLLCSHVLYWLTICCWLVTSRPGQRAPRPLGLLPLPLPVRRRTLWRPARARSHVRTHSSHTEHTRTRSRGPPARKVQAGPPCTRRRERASESARAIETGARGVVRNFLRHARAVACVSSRRADATQQCDR